MNKSTPNRLTEEERQARRQHQIDLGKSTQGYRNLVVLRDNGVIPKGPKTPDPTVQNVSKRQFDKEIREWRRKLHAFDNVDFESLKAKVYEKRKDQAEPEYLDILLGKEIRALVEREMLLRTKPATKKQTRPEKPQPKPTRREEPKRRKSPATDFRSRSAYSSTSMSSKSSLDPVVSLTPPLHKNYLPKRLVIENDVLRMKVQELTYQNTSLLERLHQQDMLLRSLIFENEFAAPQGYSRDYDEFARVLNPLSSSKAWFHPNAALI